MYKSQQDMNLMKLKNDEKRIKNFIKYFDQFKGNDTMTLLTCKATLF
jgi:hypothetical protein